MNEDEAIVSWVKSKSNNSKSYENFEIYQDK